MQLSLSHLYSLRHETRRVLLGIINECETPAHIHLKKKNNVEEVNMTINSNVVPYYCIK